MCIKHKVSGWDQLGSSESKEEMFGCHIVRQLSNVEKEQLRMASSAEREMREMLMRIGGDDPDERSKHGVPRQQDLTQQQPPPPSSPQKQQPPTVSAATAKTAVKTGSKTTAVSSRTKTKSETGRAKTRTNTSATGVWTESGTTADTTTETTSSSARLFGRGWTGKATSCSGRRFARWRRIKSHSLICHLFQRTMICMPR